VRERSKGLFQLVRDPMSGMTHGIGALLAVIGLIVLIERALDEITETMERIRQDSRANREAIINEVMTVKSNRDKRTVSERFEKINYLWNHYLEPSKT